MEKNDHISFGVTSHYNQYTGFEVVDVCEQLRSPDGTGAFSRGNAFKYLARAGWKDPGNRRKEIEDLNKAKIYIEREIARLEALVESEKNETYGVTLTPMGMNEEQFYNNIREYLGEPNIMHNPRTCPVCHRTLMMNGGKNWRVCPDNHGHFMCDDMSSDLWAWIAEPAVLAEKNPNYPYRTKAQNDAE